MPHPEHCYAFNEHSSPQRLERCCEGAVDARSVIEFLDFARAWRIHNSAPLVRALKADLLFSVLLNGPRRGKLQILLESAGNRRISPSLANAPEVVLPGDGPHGEEQRAIGLAQAIALGGWAISWPCGCMAWASATLTVTTSGVNKKLIECRHASSIDHLRQHWMAACRMAERSRRDLRSFLRVDNAQNTSGVEIPQIHFDDGTALNIDGTWKHGERVLNPREVRWLRAVGWIVPSSH
jgi:hypothetical protein